MTKLSGFALIAASLFCGSAARADYVIIDGTNHQQTVKSFTCTAKICPQATLADTTGAAVGVTGNPIKTDGSATTQPVSASTLPLPTGAATSANQTSVISAPGTPQTQAITIQGNVSGIPVPITGTLSASIGGFAPGNSYATLAVSNSSSNVSLPTGTVVVIYNTGANDAYVHLGSSGVTATTSQDVVKAGQTIALTVGANDHLAAITASSTTSLTLSGGAGLFTGVGGGSSGGGGGGAVTIADGADITQGAKADAKSAATDTTPITLMQAVKELSFLEQNPVSRAVTNAGTFLVQAAQSGTWNITNISGTISLPTGAATSANQPTNAAIASTTSGQTGNLHMAAVTTSAPTYTTGQTDPLSLTTGGALRVDGSGATQPVSAASLPLPAGASTSALQPTNAAQGSTTSGQTGPLIQGAVTTGLPTYTTAQTSPLSLDTSGNLRVNVVAGGAGGGAVTVADGADVAQGAKADSAYAGSGAATVIAILKGLYASATGSIPAGSALIGGVNLVDSAGTNKAAVNSGGQLAIQGSAAQGSTTSGEVGVLMQGAVTTSAPSYTTAQTSPLSLDTAGNLRVNVVTGGGSGGTSSSFSAAFPSTGTAIGAKNGANMVNLAADASNNLNVNLQTALPAGTNLIGKAGIDQTTNGTTNGVSIVGVNSSTALGGAGAVGAGAQRVAVGQDTTTIAGSAPGIAGTPSANVLSVQGATSMTPLKVDGSAVTQPISAASLPLPTGASTSANQPTNAAIGSTTSGQTGHLMLGAVTTGAPTYTTAQTNPLSLDTAGNLRVNVVAGGGTGGTSSSFGSTFPSTGTAIGAKNGANMVNLAADASNNLDVNLQTALPAGTNVIGVVGNAQASTTSGQSGPLIQAAVTTSAPSYTTAQTSPLSLTTGGALRVDASAAAIFASPQPTTTGGLTTYFLQPAASDNHANIKNGAGQIYHVAVTNNSATINYVRFYNAATGFNGCNSATNLVYQLAIPASTSGAGFVQDISMGIAFSTGISVCVTSGYATTDTTSATASAMSVMVGYK